MELALVRHGQTDWNLAELVQGRTDIPLNDTGRDQARTTAERLAADPESWDLVLSSPLTRASETAEIISSALGVPFGGTVDGLIEQDFGEGEGLPVAELYERWPERGFTGGELDDELGARGIRTLSEIADQLPEARRLLLVSHGSLIRGTIASLTGHPYGRIPRLPNTSVSRFERDPEWRVLTIGDVPYDEAMSAAR